MQLVRGVLWKEDIRAQRQFFLHTVPAQNDLFVSKRRNQLIKAINKQRNESINYMRTF